MFRSVSRSAMRIPMFVGLVAVTEAFIAPKSGFTTNHVATSPLRATNAKVAHEEGQAAARMPGATYTIADQPARFARGKEEGNERMLNIDKFYNPDYFKGKRVLVTGGNRGLGRAISDALVDAGAETIITCRSLSDDVMNAGFAQVVSGIELTSTDSVNKLATEIEKPIDILINNAGYFYEPLETIETMNFDEELKMIDICAVAPLRVSAALYNGGLLKEGSKIAMITSQGGSVDWRFTQNPEGHDFGHHMSKAAANMGGVILAQELRSKGITVINLHPGFNKTGMTKKYEHIWEIEGAVDCAVGAKRTLHEVSVASMETSGSFINCEDGLQIPY